MEIQVIKIFSQYAVDAVSPEFYLQIIGWSAAASSLLPSSYVKRIILMDLSVHLIILIFLSTFAIFAVITWEQWFPLVVLQDFVKHATPDSLDKGIDLLSLIL